MQRSKVVIADIDLLDEPDRYEITLYNSRFGPADKTATVDTKEEAIDLARKWVLEHVATVERILIKRRMKITKIPAREF